MIERGGCLRFLHKAPLSFLVYQRARRERRGSHAIDEQCSRHSDSPTAFDADRRRITVPRGAKPR
jgi:hypothetical protein